MWGSPCVFVGAWRGCGEEGEEEEEEGDCCFFVLFVLECNDTHTRMHTSTTQKGIEAWGRGEGRDFGT